MALYKYAQYLSTSDSDAFDKLWEPGQVPAHSGIYRCTNCGDEDACNKGNPLPPQNHRQHNPNLGPIRWKLLVYAQQQQ
jgi:hypothetical protein